MQLQDLANINFTTLKAGLTGISGAAKTYSTGAAGVTQCFQGKAVAKAQDSGVTMPTTDAVTGLAFPALAANQGTVIVFAYDSSGNIKVAQGSIESLDSGGNFARAPQFPVLGDTLCAFAYVVIKDGATGGAFTVGGSNWNTTGLTYSVQDVYFLPSRPQIA
jgi:hypothetical protein